MLGKMCIMPTIQQFGLQFDFKQHQKSHLAEGVEALLAEKSQQPSFGSFALQVRCSCFDIPTHITQPSLFIVKGFLSGIMNVELQAGEQRYEGPHSNCLSQEESANAC